MFVGMYVFMDISTCAPHVFVCFCYAQQLWLSAALLGSVLLEFTIALSVESERWTSNASCLS